MAWLRVESSFPQHKKIMAAAERLGRGSIARVIGVWSLGACHAVTHLTDGFVPTFILENPTYDKKVKDIVSAMLGAGLIRAVEGGYQYHDFNHYNPSAEAVLAKRKADLERKNRDGKHTDQPQNRHGKTEVPSGKNSARARGRAPASESESESPDQDPLNADPDPTLNPNPLSKDQDHRRNAGIRGN